MPTEPTYAGPPVITKNPTSETVREGGYAEFVARADNCISIIWHLQSPGGGTDVLAKDAPSRFPGLIVTGLETERIGLNGIPKALNEWRVRAEFVGGSGNVWSEAAIITVMNQELTAPTIQSQPKSVNLKNGQTTSLQVTAKSVDQGTTLTYQWYKNTVNSNVGGKAILGATASTYTPAYAEGTVYYYCAVRSTDGTDISAATKTACAAVTYPIVEEPTTATTAATTAATQPASAATLAPWGTGTEPETQTEATLPLNSNPAPARSNTLLVVIVVVIIVIAVLGVIAAVLILKFYPGREEPQQSPPRPRREPAPRQQPKHQPTTQAEEEWDDLSDLDLSAYLDDDDEL